jgi:hypothetical protein
MILDETNLTAKGVADKQVHIEFLTAQIQQIRAQLKIKTVAARFQAFATRCWRCTPVI